MTVGVPSMSGDETLGRLERECIEYLTSLEGDVAHDLDHIQRVVANAKALARAEQADERVVIPAAWLHDCVAVPKNSPDRPRASALAAEEATRLLSSWGYDDLPFGEIAHAIEAHSFSAGIAPESLEARVLQDADRLDALGAIGLARCLMLGGELGRPLYISSDPFCERREPDDLAATVDHFYTKLLHLSDLFQTTAGRAEADRRTAVLRRFLDELSHELAWADRG
ncbi:MAG: HD domain-containing protein [Acidobacteriota bacterium]